MANNIVEHIEPRKVKAIELALRNAGLWPSTGYGEVNVNIVSDRICFISPLTKIKTN